MDFDVRPATVDDAEAIVRMQFQAWQESYGRLLPPEFFTAEEPRLPARVERYREAIARQETRLLATDPDGGLVGIAACGPGRDDDSPCDRELFMIYTLQRVHGQGVGQALVDAVAGTGAAFLWVLEDNPRAQAFYRRNGFVPDGTHRLCSPAWHELPELRMVRPAVGH